MPSSHGGGFGGGGSFGGGFHSSGPHSSGNYTPTYSRRPFPGATRYSYINRHGMMCYFFFAGTPRRIPRTNMILPIIILVIALIVASIIPLFMIPRKLSSRDCQFSGSYYEDDVGIIADKESLDSSFADFYEKTGVQPYLYIINADAFPKQYGNITKDSLESFAYDLYLYLFDDEGHWLILFVEYDSSPYFGWIEMHGDLTARIINESFFKDFQKDMQTYLNDSRYTHEQGIVDAMNNATTNALKVNSSIVRDLIFFILIALFILAAIITWVVSSVKQTLTINGYVDYVEKHPEKAKPSKEEEDTSAILKDEDPFI